MSPPQPLPPWCERLTREFHAADQRAIALAAELSLEQLNWQPAPGRWSIGQCLEHLYQTNRHYLPPIMAALSGGARRRQVSEIRPGWFGRLFIRSFIEPSLPLRRAKAPGKIKPGPSVEADILERFLASNEEARAAVLRAAEYDVNRVRFRNPFVGPIRFTVGTGFEILSPHQRRHLIQAENVRREAGFPAA